MNLLARVNPVTRIVLATIVSLPLLFTLDWVSATVALVGELVLMPLCGVGLGLLARRSVPIVVAAVLGSFTMVLYGQPGGRVWWHWTLVTVSDNSIRLATAILLRVLALGVPAILLFTGVDATDMADGLGQVFRLPARFVLGTLAGFRMLGVFVDDWRSIGQARRARGLGDAERVRRFATMAFGLLVVAIRRGTRLATAMEARGLGAPGVTRTWARPSRLGRADAAAIGLVSALMAAALLSAWWAGTFWLVWS
ncbi:MAG TPA: energy-coupling factor transporter transmembrane component T [Propionibacteriaceae bacterium]|nr:energy-coupling factor transporter transmembrane component T [Propionibacteriaceae bacterium]